MPKRKRTLFTKNDLHPEHPVTVGKAITTPRTGTMGTWSKGIFYEGKLHLNPGNFPKGKARAQRVFLKPMNNIYDASEVASINSKMRQAGLPALKTVAVRQGNRIFLAIEPFIRRKKSALIPINTNRKKPTVPCFLEKLNIKEHSRLISQLAEDVAQIHNLGINTNFFEYFGFYRTKNGYSRKIMDIGRFAETRDTVILKRDIRVTLHQIRKIWGEKPEMQLFIETLKQSLNPELKDYENP